MKTYISVIFVLSLSYFSVSIAQDKKQEVKKELPVTNDFVDFGKIKNILRKDGLEKVVKKKKIIEKKKKIIKKNKSIRLYNLPERDDFWKIFFEYWLVKNNAILKWDFHKPDYGLQEYFEEYLKLIGEIGLRYKILYVNTTNVTHLGLPMGTNEYLFIVSVPFIKTLDLSKLQISILLYEDLLRVKMGYIENKFNSKLIEKLTDGNFYKKKYPKEEFEKLMNEMDIFIFEKGFSFKEQYQVTKRMNSVLTNNKKFWQNYFTMLEKIDELSKSNLLYKQYSKIFPSPELQLNWINPTKRR